MQHGTTMKMYAFLYSPTHVTCSTHLQSHLPCISTHHNNILLSAGRPSQLKSVIENASFSYAKGIWHLTEQLAHLPSFLSHQFLKLPNPLRSLAAWPSSCTDPHQFASCQFPNTCLLVLMNYQQEKNYCPVKSQNVGCPDHHLNKYQDLNPSGDVGHANDARRSGLLSAVHNLEIQNKYCDSQKETSCYTNQGVPRVQETVVEKTLLVVYTTATLNVTSILRERLTYLQKK